jgi:choline-sulfatase
VSLRRALPALLAVTLACEHTGAPPGTPVSIDLAHLFRVSDAGPRTSSISLAAPDEPHQLLWGWSRPVTAPDGRPAVLIDAAQAALTFRAGSDPQQMFLFVDRTLEPVAGPHRPPEGVRIHVNGVFVGRLDPPRDRLEIALPPGALKPGRNLLSFHLIKRPREDPARPTLRYFYREIRFRSGVSPGVEPRLGGTDALILPAGSTASFFLRSPIRARLRATIERGRGRLLVRTQKDGGAARLVFERALVPADALDVPLGLTAGAIARVDVAVVEGEVALRRPRIEGTRPVVTPPPAAGPSTRPNVLLYVIDTLRADALDWEDGARRISPNLARLADESIVFESTVAQSSWTRPSVVSMLTGLHPSSHGVLSLGDRLGPQVPLLPEILRDAGYDTAAFVTNVNVSSPFGLQRGFTTFRYLHEKPTTDTVYVPARVLDDEVFAWLATPRERPFFLWVQASDPHAPYRPSEPFATRFAPPEPASTLDPVSPLRSLRNLRGRSDLLNPANVERLRALYRAEVAELDAELGRFFTTLAERGLLDDTIVVVVGDHGEEFHDHGGFEHGNTLYQELVRVPLLVRLPHGGGARSRVLAQHVDLVPTLLTLLGLPVPPELPGRPLLTGSGTVVADDGAEAFSTTWFGRTALSSLVVPPWKVIVPMRSDRALEVFDLAHDPGERHDLAARHPVLIGYARQRMAELEAAGEHVPRGGPAALDAETRERLRRLGYAVE